MLCYGVSADACDEYIRIGESTAMKYFYLFCRTIVDVFGHQYRRQPTADDIEYYLKINARRGFPGMFASIDCTHWKWDKCPVAWQGQFRVTPFCYRNQSGLITFCRTKTEIALLLWKQLQPATCGSGIVISDCRDQITISTLLIALR